MNWPAPTLPPGVVTVMFTVPEPAGPVTVISVLESELIFAAVPPKLTPVAPDRFCPVIVTEVPPASPARSSGRPWRPSVPESCRCTGRRWR